MYGIVCWRCGSEILGPAADDDELELGKNAGDGPKMWSQAASLCIAVNVVFFSCASIVRLFSMCLHNEAFKWNGWNVQVSL